MSAFDLEREANIARNRELLAQLGISNPVPAKTPVKVQTKAKPVQPVRKKRKVITPPPQRQTRSSARLRQPVVDPNESPSKRRKREREEEELRRKEEEERLAEEERLREAKRPRHHDLDLHILCDELEETELNSLRYAFQSILKTSNPRRTAGQDAFAYDNSDDKQEDKEGEDKHGQLGIWDARAPAEEIADEDDDVTSDQREGGKYWRLQQHWPATTQSSISSIKLDPIDAHSVYTSAYDCTIRQLSFTSGISREIYSSEDSLISCIDLVPTGQEMWISDADGGVTRLDLREGKSKARRHQVSERGKKIGSVSVNPRQPHFILTASNDKILKVWDARKLAVVETANPYDVEYEAIGNFCETKEGKACLRGAWQHGQSVSAAYWDARGRGIVSTSYDDKLRLWDIIPQFQRSDAPFPTFRPIKEIRHDCQTGRWVTILKAQWSPNPDAYPHFTIGNMQHSLDIYSGKGDLLARLADKTRVTAVQAVTCSHPNIVERAASGNGSGRCILWAPPDV
ncbi:WD40 repeat-like protein [Panus rudis PR-1116 ss-1]|nr:WD40 repeat-like protein [Panus rudis PR-1116 ss-1]